jgi:hypothetical protein
LIGLSNLSGRTLSYLEVAVDFLIFDDTVHHQYTTWNLDTNAQQTLYLEFLNALVAASAGIPFLSAQTTESCFAAVF